MAVHPLRPRWGLRQRQNRCGKGRRTMYRRSLEPQPLDALWLEAETEAFALKLVGLELPTESAPRGPPSLGEINDLDFYALADNDDPAHTGSSTSSPESIEQCDELAPRSAGARLVPGRRPNGAPGKTVVERAYSQIDVTRVRAEMQLVVSQLQRENAELKKRLKASEALANQQKQQLHAKHNLKVAAKDRHVGQLKVQLEAESTAKAALLVTVAALETDLADVRFEMRMMDKAYATERAVWVEKEQLLRSLNTSSSHY
ncbi:hypothetical protein SDRG_06611 [Saprolegnia diclina VS20]|uniref:Uncharacterized protein n=1 Tax=Saprolegnia diclina (strain VS20) TaxID=1156394 RepID=T0QMB9_SAPDV|nr:hypothetical protein SDRG_06611 [Saprolegnia diclina VS20]EQC35861.1 hypothetical protein SDRG_06611 [Saprolegnia diclina VS20]|eukprot:XP_008610623.1 hypothetical protein SDRG_06611 [Saprolegnia diclina VS20]